MLAAVAVLALGAAVVGGIGGFGTGIILTAALTPLLGVKAVIPVLAVAGTLINAGRFWFYRESLDRAVLGRSLAASLPFLALGTWVYSVLDARAIGTVLGVAVIASIPLRRWLAGRQAALGPRAFVAGQSVFGFASGITTGTGVIQVSLLLGIGLSGPAVLATDALATIVLDLAKAALFHRFDLLDGASAATGAVIGLATFPGSALAAWLTKKMGAKLHILFMEGLVVLGGASMFWHAWR